ncbi:hypothetical protein [Sphingomonas sp. CARO-RG-8B-R24-01]|uniref:hypothetical protein n=1 Tax=Sphingomonas sp. CARO-RG-8B-R24-01 TaxID=2914831 RepID=UPI001F5A32BE|nr:hypothetical protein [Sphingomonas sp. CARO-RG-8B-R24-01]
MDAALDLPGYAHALGRAQAAWRFASAELRKASALATVSAAWDIYLRDAGAGDVGPAHETTIAAAQLLSTDDPRRDGVLLWLADHAVPAIAEAAATLARMLGATRRFGTEDQDLLDAARDALAISSATPGPIGTVVAAASGSNHAVLEPLLIVAAAVDRLRGDAGFLEGSGHEVRLPLPRGTLTRYVAAAPAGCWALNLALLGAGAHAAGVPPPPGLASRASFRSGFEPEEIAGGLVRDAAAGWSGAYDRLSWLEPELARGRDALAHLSRNARTRHAWLIIAPMGSCTRTQLARALGLSRAGADIQACALAVAGLVTLGAGGQIAWTRKRPVDASAPPLDQGPLGDAVSDLDANLAQIDRLLARTAR